MDGAPSAAMLRAAHGGGNAGDRERADRMVGSGATRCGKQNSPRRHEAGKHWCFEQSAIEVLLRGLRVFVVKLWSDYPPRGFAAARWTGAATALMTCASTKD
jgi:hypothetical protein